MIMQERTFSYKLLPDQNSESDQADLVLIHHIEFRS